MKFRLDAGQPLRRHLMGVVLACAAASAGAQVTVKVSGFQVSGNTLLEPARLDAVLMPMLGMRTAEELQRAAAAVQHLYAAEGYGAVVAYLPQQSGEAGIVTIAVVEGRIGEVKVAGISRYSAERIRAALPDLIVGQTPRLTRIDAELRMANENPGRQLQLLLQPGQKAGEAEARISVQEQPVTRTTLGLDNTGNQRTGDYRASLGWSHADLTGHDDVFSAQAQTSPSEPSLVRVLSVGYRLPVYSRRLAFDLFAAYSDVEGGNTPTVAGDLNFNGRGRVVGARAGWYLPRWGDFDQRVTVGIDHRAYLNTCSIAGLPSGACGAAGESVTVHPLSLDYAMQSGGSPTLGFNVSLSGNLRLGGSHTGVASFEAVRSGASPGYTALRFGANAGTAFAEDWSLRGRVTGQLSRDPLVPGEQFGIGGAASVRGYEERELVGDSGAFASLEIGSPALWADARTGRLHLLAFAEAAYVANQQDTPCVEDRSHCTLASLGVGARHTLGALQTRLDLAYALKSAARTQRGDAKLHFAVNYGF